MLNLQSLKYSILLALISQISSLSAQCSPFIQYTPLSNAALKNGKLAIYENCATNNGKIKLGNYSLEYQMPKSARAYDVIPIKYKLIQPAGARRAAVEAVAFEDAKRARNKPLYDLAIPGNLNVKIDYLGSVCADYENEKYIPLTPDAKAPVSPFPPFRRDPMVCSSTIREAQIVWFKFRVTNTGDTILDPEGFGATLGSPNIIKIGKDGEQEWVAEPINGRVRHLNYIYPGESFEFWTDIYCPHFGPEYCHGLREGKYILNFIMQYRYYRTYDWWINIWLGKDFAKLSIPITVTKDGGNTPIEPKFEITDKEEKMPGYINEFEEFMTSFRIYEGVKEDTIRKGTIYLQVAPWTTTVTLKLILANPRDISVARIPIKISCETLRIKYNPKNPMVICENGREEPVFVAQAMPAMRSGIQLGPYPEIHMLNEIREMKQLGVNLIANTSGGWWIPEITGRKGVELLSACYKYWYDVLVRKMGLKLEGWSVYPPSGLAWYENVEPLIGREISYSTAENGYNGALKSVDLADPIVPEVIAAWTIYNYERWGDMWFAAKDGSVPISIEDTWGWMRDDINIRYYLGPLAISQFRKWVKEKYGTIDQVNKAWNSNYSDFNEIDPQKDQGIEGDGLDNKPVYNKKDHVFHDWSPATEGWDIFRTQLRMDIYKKALELIRKTIPNAEFDLRTEGANIPIKGDGKSENSHWRHIYYSQRRNAMVQDVVEKEKVIKFYSDYTTIPYMEDEWRYAMRQMASSCIIPMFLPQFDHMRDILLNPHYGRDYQMHYNLEKPSRGVMIHCLVAAYPWWKATYEEGGAPGIIWSDYLCDGFATETQKRELKLLRENFRKMYQKIPKK